MALIPVKCPWTKKPNWFVGTDLSKPFAGSIKTHYLFNERVGLVIRDQARKNDGAIGRSSYTWDVDGWTQTSQAADTNSYINTGYTVESTGTIILDITVNSLYDYVSLFDNTGAGNHYEGWIYANGQLAARTIDSDTKTDTAIGAIVAGNRYQIAFSWNEGSNAKLYLDGILEDTQACTAGTKGTVGLAGINDNNTGGKITIHQAVIFNEQLPDGFVAAYSNNLLQLLQPRTLYIPIAAAEEPTVLLPIKRPWTKQPHYPVPIAKKWRKPGLSVFLPPYLIDMATGLPSIAEAARADYGVGPSGRTYKYTGATWSDAFTLSGGGTPESFLFIFQGSIGTNASILGSTGDGVRSNGGAWELRVSSNARCTSSNAPAAGDVVFARGKTSDYLLIVNNEVITAGGAYGNWNGISSVGDSDGEELALIIRWAGADQPTQAEAIELVSNPWQIFEPRTQYIPVIDEEPPVIPPSLLAFLLAHNF